MSCSERQRLARWMLLAVTVAACGSRPRGLPLPEAVEPTSASNLADVPVLIRGTGFPVVPLQHLGGGEAVTARDDFRAWLGEQELSAVTYIDDRTLSAVIPAGVPPGRHALKVQDPFRRTGVLEGAFEAIGHATLRGVAAASPARVSVGQAFTLTLEVANDGSVDAVEVLPSPPSGQGTGDASFVETLATEVVPAAGTRTFQWTGTATRRGVLHFELDAAGANGQSGEPIAMATVRSNDLVVDAPAALMGALDASPAVVSEGQRVTVTLTVQNAGEATALGVTPVMALVSGVESGAGSAVPISGPTPAAADIASGGAQRFTWEYEARAAGTASFGAQATGADANSGAPVSSTSATAPMTIQTPATLTASLASSPSIVSEGQAIDVTLTVQNTGDAPARSVTPGALVPSGTGSVALVSGPAPASADIAGGSSTSFTWRYRAVAASGVTFSGQAGGSDGNSGAPVVGTTLTEGAVTIQRPAALVSAIDIQPTLVSQGQLITVTMTVRNTGEADAVAVTPAAPVTRGTGTASLQSGPSPGSAVIEGGGARSFVWVYRAANLGTFGISTRASGADANSGQTVTSPSVTSEMVTIESPSVLAAWISAAPSPISQGQTLTVTLTVQNNGGATANDVVPSPVVLGGAGVATLLSGPTPDRVNLTGGASQSFVWQYQATGAGDVTFTASASGTDANSGARLVSNESTSAPVSIQTPAALAVALSGSPGVVSEGQPFTVTLTIQNTGGANATDVAPTGLSVGGTGIATISSGPSPTSAAIPGAGSQAFTWQLRAVSAGSPTFTTRASGTDANSGAPLLSPSASASPVLIQIPARLSVDMRGTPGTVNVDQTITATLTVQNTGEAAALGVAPSMLTLGGTSAATLLAGPWPTTADIPAGEAQSFVWQVRPTTPGTVTFTAQASGTDGNSGAPVSSSSALSSPLTVQRPAALSAAFTVPPRVNLGQRFTLTMQATNTGDSGAGAVTPSALTLGGTGGATRSSGPTPASQSIPGAASRAFAWTYSASRLGTLTFSGRASGTDFVSDTPVSSATAQSSISIVERPAALTASVSLPTLLVEGKQFTVRMTVQNTGDAVANAVAPSSLTLAGTGVVTRVSGPSPAAASLSGGSSQVFSWTYAATLAGMVSLSGNATGTDANDGLLVTAPTATSNGALIVLEVEPILTDPFGDGTPFSFVFKYGGKLYLGPRQNGSGAVRANPDGSGVEGIGFAMYRDSIGSTTMKNTSAPPYPSSGHPGCTPDTHECGPDNENARGLLFSGTIAGVEWLGLGGAISNAGLNYLYMTRDTDTALDLAYTDLSVRTRGQTLGISAAHVFRDRLYLGFAGTGGGRPLFYVLSRMPTSLPGLEASATDLVDLEAKSMPAFSTGGAVAMIDTIADFNDRLYAFNNTGAMRSTTNAPRGYVLNPSDWALATPSAAPITLPAVAPTTGYNLEPADKAWPQAVVFHGKLYAARNLRSPSNSALGAQLWVCDPALQGSATDCDPGDWSVIAPNAAGVPGQTTFENANNTAITLLAATPTHLYVGFNNAVDGVVLFRSRAGVTSPTQRSDFEGTRGCSAANHPASCQGLGTNGFGVPTNQRIFAGETLSFGGTDSVYLTTGDDGSGVRVYRVVE